MKLQVQSDVNSSTVYSQDELERLALELAIPHGGLIESWVAVNLSNRTATLWVRVHELTGEHCYNMAL